MPKKTSEELQQDAMRGLGPHVDQFAQYAATELWRQCERTAVALGFTPAEATAIAMTTIENTIRALVGAIDQARRDRLFQKMR